LFCNQSPVLFSSCKTKHSFHSPLHLALATNHCSFSIISTTLVFHTSEIIQYLSFCKLLISLSLMFSRSTHVIECVRISLLFKSEEWPLLLTCQVYPCICWWTLNSAGMSTSVQIPLKILLSILLGIFLEAEMYGCFIFNFQRMYIFFYILSPYWAVTLTYICCTQMWRFSGSPVLPPSLNYSPPVPWIGTGLG
jgi:hypothetical protein